MVGKIRAAWIDTISNFQKYDFDDMNFSICEKHFAEEDLVIEGEKKSLKIGAKPSIFHQSSSLDLPNIFPEKDSSNTSHSDECFTEQYADIDYVENSICKGCVDLNTELTKLKITLDKHKSELVAQRKLLKKERENLVKLRKENEKLRMDRSNQTTDVSIL